MCLSRLLDRGILKLDDLATLFQRHPIPLGRVEILWKMKLNQSRHSNLFRTEYEPSFHFAVYG